MKKRPSYNFRQVFVCIFLFLALIPSVSAKATASVPAPTFELKNVDSDYLEELEKMRVAIGQGKTLKCYQAASMFEKKMKANKQIRAIEQREQVTKEDVLARDWWLYYITIAPLLKGEEYMHFSPRGQPDLIHKYNAILILERRRPSEMAKLLSANEKTILARDNAWMQEIIAAFFSVEPEANAFNKQLTVLLEKFDIKYFPKGLHVSDPEGLRWNMERWRIHNKMSMIRDRRADCAPRLESAGKLFARKIVHDFPDNGDRVQSILMRAGYNTKEKCRDILIKSVGMSKDTRYLFRGLPPPEKPTTGKKGL